MEKFVSLVASGVAHGAVISLVALGFAVLHKATGVINFAHGELVTLGGYVAFWAIADRGMPIVGGYAVAVAVLFVVGVAVERAAYAPLRSRPQIVVVISTLAASVVIRGGIALWQGSTPKSLPSPVGLDTVSILGADIAAQRILIIATVVVVMALVGAVFTTTSAGRQVRALAADRETAQLYGVRVARVSMLVFGASAALAALAGVLIAPLSALDIDLGFAALVGSFAAVVLGGFESLPTIVVAAVGLGLAQHVVGGYLFPDYAYVVPFVVIFVVISLRPQGLVSMEHSRL